MFGCTDHHINFNSTNDENTEYQYESINVFEPLLSCVDFKKFWFKWADGMFYFGRGEVNTQVLAYMTDDYGPRTFETLHLRNMQMVPNVLEWEFQNDAGISVIMLHVMCKRAFAFQLLSLIELVFYLCKTI